MPYTFDTQRQPPAARAATSYGEEFFVYCRDAFDWLYRLGAQGRPRMMTIGLHGRIIGRPGRIGALARLLEHMQRHERRLAVHRAAIGAALDDPLPAKLSGATIRSPIERARKKGTHDIEPR